MQHLDEGTIHAWLDGALPEEERARVAAHASECDHCAAMVAEARGMIAAAGRIVSGLDIVRGDVLPARGQAAPRSLWRRLRFTPARAALAATLLIAVASTLTVRRGVLRDARRQQEAAASAPLARVMAQPSAAAPAVAPAVARAASPVRAHLDETRKQGPPKITVEAPKPKMETQAAAAPAAQARAPRSDSIVAAAAPPRAMADQAEQTLRQRAFKVAAAAGQGRVPATATQMFSAVATLEAPFAGCYAVTSDTARALAQLPDHFALQTSERQNVVRAVTPDGRVDSIVPGSVWHPVNTTLANVTWTTARGRGQLELHLDGGEVRAQATTASGEQRPVGLTRSICRP